ncbi:phosphatidate cytidylyltransferase [Patiriisocius marinus]|uniref:Phosphatidate cytidylyltransferase n=1 Tax=Patiriisocius marinus TaxID=1397112 RepID=A0A5J4J1A8_9FLAO|nr:phosphatidate cytidylyltransferase [Patiriisocius marinus]GER59778.1 phosphatidate cytidylyltransferase [Patiriisocius marinus]
MREVIVRTISGVLYILIVIFSMYTSREWFMALFFLLGILVLKEFLKLVHLTSYIAYVLLAAGLYFLSYNTFADQAVNIYLILSCFVCLFLFKDMLWTSKIPMFEKKKYITTIFYIISGFVFLTLIPFSNGTFMPEIIVAVFSLIWANDTMAYVIGKSFGKHKLLERISPKKTIEGFLGGLGGSLIAGFIIFKLTNIYNLPIWLCLALIASVFGTIGDLVQSKFKRQAGVKDSGNLMPGHGGLYDRLDSVVYASPFIFAFLEIVDYVS